MDFLHEWRNQLPEPWRQLAALSALKVFQKNSDDQDDIVSNLTFPSANILGHQKE